MEDSLVPDMGTVLSVYNFLYYTEPMVISNAPIIKFLNKKNCNNTLQASQS